jgi:hypothetical protein
MRRAALRRLGLAYASAALLSACSSAPDESATPPPNAHDLAAVEPGDQVAFTAFDDEGPYATVTVERGKEQPAGAGVPDVLRGARYLAVRFRYEFTAPRGDMAAGQTNWYLYQPTRGGQFQAVASGVTDLEPALPAFIRPLNAGDVVEGWLMVEVTRDRLDDDLYLAYADSGPFTADECCVPAAPRRVSDTDALILVRSGDRA